MFSGVWPVGGGFQGPGGGVIRIDSVGGGAIPLSRVSIVGPTGVNKCSTDYYHGEAQFDAISYNFDFKSMTWTPSLPSIEGGGVSPPAL